MVECFECYAKDFGGEPFFFVADGVVYRFNFVGNGAYGIEPEHACRAF